MKKTIKFRIPRKVKKKIKKDFWLYPMDEVEKTYMGANPHENQEDYDAFKRNELIGMLFNIKKNYKNEQKSK
jgi:hypothetical protein